MVPQPIPEELRRFLLTSIASVPHLEALLLLRTSAQRDWSAQAVAERLYIGDQLAVTLLADLSRAGMTVTLRHAGSEPVFRYQPATAALGRVIDALADLYGRRLVDVTHLIHSKLERRAKQLADAFTWRNES
ncbi:hypothetical protein [Massilia antarctica]|uniref:hypothetical protein n=1 Tax=Massilia antarctica TaxID=2765360 RepID=UPI0006BB5D22|nr:hypothetical protein [Massilia sp. H27-R4]MCY0910201.1 hypothetical protein [Massilia sp. H27-R4]CUI02705.1 hypothetical protein BN2497_187 [Janthinobacterium sp. CG23_2]CUU26491.1 hypothetical protein BN3177_187 [Janthinobacterium sp. CG23_2]